MSLSALETEFEIGENTPANDNFDDLLDFLDMSWDDLFAEIDFDEYLEITSMGWYH